MKFGLEILENPRELLVNNVLGCSREEGCGTVLISLPGEANSIRGAFCSTIGDEALNLAVLPD